MPDQSEAALTTGPRKGWRRFAVVALAIVVVAFGAPTLVDVYRQLGRTFSVPVGWLIAIVAAEAAQLTLVWAMLRILLRTRRWFDVAAPQLAGDAASNLIPAATLAGAGVQTTLMLRAGFTATRVVTALSALAVLTAVPGLVIAPITALGAAALGSAVDPRLAWSLWGGVLVTVVVLGAAAAALRGDRAWLAIAAAVTWVQRRLGREPSGEELGPRVLRERDQVLRAIRVRAKTLALLAIGRTALDFSALYFAVRAVGVNVPLHATLVAFVVGELAGRIPLTPGGLAFVEAGLTGALEVAGVPTASALLAVALYRLAATWLPTIGGIVAFVLFEARQRARAGSVAGDELDVDDLTDAVLDLGDVDDRKAPS